MSLNFGLGREVFSWFRSTPNCRTWLLILVMVVICQAVSAQQPSSGFEIDVAKLAKITDLAFPPITDQFDVNRDEFSMDVRITPSFRGTVQVSIVKHLDGSIWVKRVSLADETTSLSDQVLSMIEAGEPLELESLVRKLNVVSRESSNAKQIARTLRRFFSQTQFSSSRLVTLDGVGYEIRYVDARSEVYFSYSGGENFEPGEMPLITWARNLNKETAALLGERRPRPQK